MGSGPLDDIPAPSPGLILLSCAIEAHLSTLPARRRLKFLGAMSRLFESKTGPENVTRIRGGRHDAELKLAIAQAAAWYRACLPIWLEGE